MAKDRIKVCHIQLLPLLSGVQRTMLELLQRLDRTRFDVIVICKEEGDMTRELARLGIQTLFIPCLVRQINPILDALALLKCFQLFKRHKFDIIHTHSSKTGLIGRVAARLAGVKYVFHTVHGLPFHEFSGALLTGFYALLERIGSCFSTQIVFVNQEERELSIRMRVVPAWMAKTIYNGVNLRVAAKYDNSSVRHAFRQAQGIANDDFVVAYVGRLWEQKDPDTLARIIQLCSDFPVRFIIVGDGPQTSKLAKSLTQNKKAIMTGWLQDPMSVYPAIDVLLLPSLWEGLSRTLIEAMAFGKPLVASNIKGNRECVWPGKNGFLCTPRKAEEFAMAVKTLAADRDLYQRMSKESRRLSSQYFDAEKNCQAVIDLYNQVLS